jgi:hypothetical protein
VVQTSAFFFAQERHSLMNSHRQSRWIVIDSYRSAKIRTPFLP